MVFMQVIVPPLMSVLMGQTGEPLRASRIPGHGEEMVLDSNFFVEEVLPNFGVPRAVSEAEMDAYARASSQPGE